MTTQLISGTAQGISNATCKIESPKYILGESAGYATAIAFYKTAPLPSMSSSGVASVTMTLGLGHPLNPSDAVLNLNVHEKIALKAKISAHATLVLNAHAHIQKGTSILLDPSPATLDLNASAHVRTGAVLRPSQ